MISHVSFISPLPPGEALGVREHHRQDLLGPVYEYFLARFASAEGEKGGERLRDDKRWQSGAPPAGNANFAWVQHIEHHLVPTGVAGFVLANGSMSSNQSGEGEIRKNLIEADLVDCIVVQLREQQAEALRLDAESAKNLRAQHRWP